MQLHKKIPSHFTLPAPISKNQAEGGQNKVKMDITKLKEDRTKLKMNSVTIFQHVAYIKCESVCPTDVTSLQQFM